MLVAARGNSLQALVKYFESLSEQGIVEINIPAGIPLIYKFADSFHALKKYYLGNEEFIRQKIDSIAKQAV